MAFSRNNLEDNKKRFEKNREEQNERMGLLIFQKKREKRAQKQDDNGFLFLRIVENSRWVLPTYRFLDGGKSTKIET